MVDLNIKHNKKNRQFEVLLGDELAHLQYGFKGKTMFMMHTNVPEQMKGQGIASQLALTALNFAKDNNHKIAVMCPFVSSYVKKNPKWYDLYDREYHQNIRR